MNKKKIFFLFFLISILVSCQKGNNDTTVITSDNSLETEAVEASQNNDDRSYDDTANETGQSQTNTETVVSVDASFEAPGTEQQQSNGTIEPTESNPQQSVNDTQQLNTINNADDTQAPPLPQTEENPVIPPENNSSTPSASNAASEVNTPSLPSDTNTSPSPQTTGNEQSNTESPAAASGVTAVFTIVNSWQNNGLDCYQWNCVITNNSSAKTTSWTVTREFPKGITIIDKWNGEFTITDSGMTIRNVDYNGAIEPGGATEFGFIISSPVKLSDSGGGNIGATGNSGNSAVSVPDAASPIIPAKQTNRQTKDWLVAKGNKLYTLTGQEVWITGINWFGYNTGTNTFDGLWNVNVDVALSGIADRGFNLIRIPFSSELIRDWSKGVYPAANYNQATNAQFNQMNSLQIFDYIVDTCNALGLKIMIDIHSAKTDAMGHMKNMWYDGDITEQVYIDTLAWMARRYKDDDTIIAYDLQNEPHGKPDENPRAIWNNSNDKDNWKYVAQKAALAVLKENPNVLIVVEGIEIYPKDIKANSGFASRDSADYHFNWWGGNLRGVKDFPIDLGQYQNKLVYSPHDYGPTVYQQPWFYSGYNYESLYRDVWRDNWMFIYEDNIAPLLIGEWGGYMTEPNLTWMTHMRKLISTYRLHHTFWCYNANSGDTGGLVDHDFMTWDEKKYEFLKPVLWQHNGKFVGLSHEIPLGKNGISLNEFMGS